MIKKRGLFKYFIMVIIFIILILFLAFYFVKIFITETIQIHIEPQQLSLLLYESESTNVTFLMDVKSKKFCPAYCQIVFEDKSTGSILDNYSFEVRKNFSAKKSYEIKAPEVGEGKKIITLDLSCKSLKEKFCIFPQESKHVSSIVTLNFKHSENLARFANITKLNLLKQLSRMIEEEYQIEKLLAQYEILSPTIKYNKEKNKFELQQLKQELISTSEELKNLWAEQNYFSLDRKFARLSEMLDTIDIEVALKQYELNNTVREANELINKFEINKNNISKLRFIAKKQNKIINDLTAQYVYNLAEDFLKLAKYFSEGNFDNYEVIRDRINELENKVKYADLIMHMQIIPLFETVSYWASIISANNLTNCTTEKSHSVNSQESVSESQEATLNQPQRNCTIFEIKDYNIADFGKGQICEGCKIIIINTESFDYSQQYNLNNLSYFSEIATFLNKKIPLINDIIAKLNNDSQKQQLSPTPIIEFLNKSRAFTISDLCHSLIISFNLEDSLFVKAYLISHIENCLNQTRPDILMPYLEYVNFSEKNYTSLENIKNLCHEFEEVCFSKETKDYTFEKRYENLSIEFIDLTNFSFFFLGKINLSLKEHLPMCCVFGECRPCCTLENCINDTSSYPIVFVHGHSVNPDNSPYYSMHIFDKIQQELEKEGYLNGGVILPSHRISDFEYGDLGFAGRPATIKVTYYYDVYDNEGKLINIPSKSENIEVYARRLANLINLVKYRTGRNKVIIIAHSMGGLVVRKYLQMFGEDSVYKLILIGTPNYGISGSIETLCGVIGEKKECEDMSFNSTFLNILNLYKPKNVEIFTIAGSGCAMGNEDGDGIVLKNRVALPYAANFVIQGNCTNFESLHTAMLDPEKYPKVYELIKLFLKND